jgi:hypothetical protein
MFRPTPCLPALSKRDYVALLKWQPGERRALREAPPGVRSRLVPVIEVTTRRAREREELVRTALPNLAERMAHDVGANVPVWLDLAKIGEQHQVVVGGTSYPAMPYVYETLRDHDVTAIPVIRLGDPTTPTRFLADIMRDDGLGVCLRVRPRHLILPTGLGYQHLVHDLATRIGVSIEECDLLIDLEWLSEDTIIQPGEVARLIQTFQAIGAWRNVIVAGTSMPASLGAIPEDSIGTIPRREWVLWQRLMQLDVERPIIFGDYGVQHSEAPEQARAMKRKANIRYTMNAATLVARGRSVQDEGPLQYRQLCKAIIQHPGYQSPEFSWGDQQLEHYAMGHLEPVNEPLWRAIGTSHHLGVVTAQLHAS